MREADFAALLHLVQRLASEQRTALGRALAAASGESEAIRLLEEAFLAALPHCAATALRRWGYASGLRRYRCTACRKTFNALTGTSLARLRKKECWLRYGEALAAGTDCPAVGHSLCGPAPSRCLGLPQGHADRSLDPAPPPWSASTAVYRRIDRPAVRRAHDCRPLDQHGRALAHAAVKAPAGAMHLRPARRISAAAGRIIDVDRHGLLRFSRRRLSGTAGAAQLGRNGRAPASPRNLSGTKVSEGSMARMRFTDGKFSIAAAIRRSKSMSRSPTARSAAPPCPAAPAPACTKPGSCATATRQSIWAKACTQGGRQRQRQSSPTSSIGYGRARSDRRSTSG